MFEYIPGIRNTLADTLSRLIQMDENIKLQPEEEGKEFGYFPFEELPSVMTQVRKEVIECEVDNINIQHTDPVEKIFRSVRITHASSSSYIILRFCLNFARTYLNFAQTWPKLCPNFA